MAQEPDTQGTPEDLRSPRQKLYETCLDRMADISGAPEDYVQRCMGETPTPRTPPPENIRPQKVIHMVPGHSVKTLEKQTVPLPGIVGPCYDQLLKRMRKRNLGASGDATVSIFLRDNGRIETALVEDSEIVDETFLACLERSIVQSWKVAPSTSAPKKRNALHHSLIIFSFEPGHPSGKVSVTGPKRVRLGGLTSSEVSKALEKQSVQLRSCKAGALPAEALANRNASAAAGAKAVIVFELDIDFVINEQGKVTSLAMTEVTEADKAFQKCISDRMSTWIFPKPRGLQKTPVSQSLKLTPL